MTAGRYKVCYNSGGEGRGKRERNTAEKHQIELQKVKKKKKCIPTQKISRAKQKVDGLSDMWYFFLRARVPYLASFGAS